MNPVEIAALQDIATTLIVVGGLLTGGWMFLKYRSTARPRELDELARTVDGLGREVRELRAELGEAQDRLDFTERLLARGTPGEPKP